MGNISNNRSRKRSEKHRKKKGGRERTTIRMMAVILSMVMVLCAFSSCGSSADGAQGNAAQQNVESAAGEPPAENPENGGSPGDTDDTGNSQNAASLQNEGLQDTGSATGGTSGDIGVEQVKAIVLGRVPGATASDIYELEWEYDDGRLEYEGSLYYNGYEYEFEIDGATGNILKWEIDD